MSRKILLSPHNDDATLFASFQILGNHDIEVVTVFDSYIQPKRHPSIAELCNAEVRRTEDELAMMELEPRRLSFAGLHDDTEYSLFDIRTAVDIAAGKPDWTDVELWLPVFEEDGHDQHNRVAQAFDPAMWRPDLVSRHQYFTYTRHGGKSPHGSGCLNDFKHVQPKPEWVRSKLLALACYRSQIELGILGNTAHFLRSQEEYLLA